MEKEGKREGVEGERVLRERRGKRVSVYVEHLHLLQIRFHSQHTHSRLTWTMYVPALNPSVEKSYRVSITCVTSRTNPVPFCDIRIL